MLLAVAQELKHKGQEPGVPSRHVQDLKGELPDTRGVIELLLDLGQLWDAPLKLPVSGKLH
jgi:hypothetical protein